jgi:hypothetical protein
MQKRILQTIFSFLPLAVLITCISVLIYGASQQIIRQSAYDMPLMSVETAEARIGLGQQLSTILPNISVDLSKPYGFFFSAYTEQKQLAIAPTTVHGTPVVPPPGVFAYARAHSINKLTWQPVDGVRVATVIIYEPQTKTYLVAGRDLRDYESRIERLGLMIAVGWVVTMIVTVIAHVMISLSLSKKR